MVLVSSTGRENSADSTSAATSVLALASGEKAAINCSTSAGSVVSSRDTPRLLSPKSRRLYHYDHLIHESVGNRHLGMPIRYTYNAAFATTGSVVSLLVGAKSAAATPILVLESDLLYHPGFIEAAMDMPNDTLLVADISGSGDEVYICAGQDDRLEYLGKAAPKHLRARSLGEFSGITRMSPEFTEQYCAASEALLESGKAKGHYEELIFSLSKDGTPFFARHCSGLPWTEIDTEADFIRARDKVFPQLRAAAPAIFGPRTAVKIHSVGG